MKKVLITGGAGFIGTNLVDYLLTETGWKIRILDNLTSGSFERLKGVETLKGDIRNEKKVEEAVEGCDYLLNLAAQVGVVPSKEDPKHDAEINIVGLINLLEAAKDEDVKRFVHASSAAPLGEIEPPVSEDDVPEPMSPYGASKLAGEGYCSAYAHSFGLDTVALRFSNVYGPHSLDKESVVHKFIRRILRGKKLEIYGDGKQTRDYIHVKDICNGILRSLEEELEGFKLLQLGTEKETSVNGLVEKLGEVAEQLGVEMPEVVHKEARSGEIRRNYSDISKAKEVLGFEPSIELEEGIEETFKWYLKKGGKIR